MKTILLLEDDKNLNYGITLKLQKEGYDVLSAFGVTGAEALFAGRKIDMVISDVTLEDGNGLDFCTWVRRTSDVHFLFLTARDSELDMVTAYDLGADDYMTKPFSLMVLLSKVNAFMRRSSGGEKGCIRSGGIEVSYKEMKACKNGNALSLSPRELKLMVFLMEHAGQIVSKDQILEYVWDIDGQFVDENTVPVNISRLRSKAGEDCIQNVRGMGYIWTKESIKE